MNHKFEDVVSSHFKCEINILGHYINIYYILYFLLQIHKTKQKSAEYFVDKRIFLETRMEHEVHTNRMAMRDLLCLVQRDP